MKTTISSFVDINTPNDGVAFAKDESKYNFAYALHAGLGYKVSNNLTMELAYRYVHLGDALSGDLRTFDGINNVNNPMHFNGITSHDVKLGVRWTCCEPVAPVRAGADAPRLIDKIRFERRRRGRKSAPFSLPRITARQRLIKVNKR